MEGGFPFGMFGDPGDMQKHLQHMAEQMQTAQKVGWADNAINLAVQMTVASINRMDLTGKPEEQAAQVRDAIRVLFPEAVMLVREAREGLT
jgi:peptide deformylase